MDTRLLPVGTVTAALAGAVVVMLVVSGPLWLLLPGLLGAGLPNVLGRARTRPQLRPSPGSAVRRTSPDSRSG